MTEKEKAGHGVLYNANFDAEIIKEREYCQEVCYEFNKLRPSQTKEKQDILKGLFQKTGERFLIEQPFKCDFGYRISIGEDFYANYNLIILDGAEVEIGDYVFMGPNCSIYAAGHPFDRERRRAGLEYAWPVKIGSDVWIGGNVCILSGVSIGDGTVIAAGSVVSKDIPANVLAGGNPCRVIRNISPEDDLKYI